MAIDLFAGLGGWAEGLLAENYRVIGFDIERHVYGEHRYPAQLVLQDVLTLHGRQFRGADLIVASPPCQEYSYMAMPWTRAKAKAAAIRADGTGSELERLNRLFNACFRIQREACEAAGRHIPMVVENVRGAQEWVGRARWSFGSFYLWGDVPALMPMTRAVKVSTMGAGWYPPDHPKHVPGLGFNTHAERKHTKQDRKILNRDGHNVILPQGVYREGVKQRGSGAAWIDEALNERRREATAIKIGGGKDGWFGANTSPMRRNNSGSSARKFASAMIAKIPLPLARHIAKIYHPRALVAASVTT